MAPRLRNLIQAKKTVNFEGLDPDFVISLGWIVAHWQARGLGPFLLTSLRDSHEDKPQSAHNRGEAADIRTHHLFDGQTHETRLIEFARFLQQSGFAVVVHPEWVLGTNHLHVAKKKPFIEVVDG